MTIPKWLHGVLLSGVAVALLSVLLASVDIEIVASVLATVNPLHALGLVSFSLLTWIMLPTWRWRAILSAMGHRVSFWGLARARMGNQPLKVIIPFRGGEAFRALWLRSQAGTPLLSGLASVLFDLFLVALSQAIFLGVGLSLAVGLDGQTLGTSAVVGATTVVAVVVALWFRPLHLLGLAIVQRISPTLATRVEPLVHGFLRFGMRTKLRLLGIALIVEFGESIALWACFRTVGIEVPLFAVFTALPAILGITLLPVTIGGFGTRELAVVWLFAAYADPASLTGAALLFSAVEFVMPALFGLAFLGRFSRELAEVTGGNKPSTPDPEQVAPSARK